MQRTALFKQAWSITRHYKALWAMSLLGIVANFVFDTVFVILPTVETETLIVISGIRMFVPFLIVAFTSSALISMVHSTVRQESVTVSSGIRAGLRWMLPLTVIAFVLMIPVWLILFKPAGTVLTIFASYYSHPGTVKVTNLLNYAHFIFTNNGLILMVTLVMNAVGIGAERSVVLEGRSILVALKRGVQLAISRIGDFIVIGLVLLGLGLVISALFQGITGLLFDPLAPLLGEAFRPLSLTSPVVLFFTVVDFLICAVFVVFTSSVWTLAFREWQAQERSELPAASDVGSS
jgi:hypothetical protein